MIEEIILLPLLEEKTKYFTSDSFHTRDWHDGKIRGELIMKDDSKKYVVARLDKVTYDYFTESKREHFLMVCDRKCKDSDNGIPKWNEMNINNPEISDYNTTNYIPIEPPYFMD